MSRKVKIWKPRNVNQLPRLAFRGIVRQSNFLKLEIHIARQILYFFLHEGGNGK